MNYNLIVGGHGGTTTFTVGANGSINASGDIFTTANIGCAGIYCNLVQSSRYSSCYDNRVIRPSALSPYSVAFGFGSWGNNDDGVSWADTMHFNTYSDGSGGNQSLLMIRKSSGMGLRIWQGGFGSTSPYSTALDASLVAPSDIRLKENIEPLKNSLSNILQLQGITYNWKKEYDNLTNNEASSKVEIGFIAQDVENIIPEVVSKNKAVFKGIDNVLTIQYEKLVPVLVEAIKEQQNKINELENKLNNLYNLLTKNGIINSNI